MERTEAVTESVQSHLQAYMIKKKLTIWDIADISGVPYAVVWRVMHDYPVTYRSASRIRIGLGRLCGEWYTAPIVTDDEETATGPLPMINTPPMRQVKRRRTTDVDAGAGERYFRSKG
jgi:hypothetical protein